MDYTFSKGQSNIVQVVYLVKNSSSLVIKSKIENMLVKPATTKWLRGKPDPNALSSNPEDAMVRVLVEVPAEYKKVSHQVIVSPASTREVAIPRPSIPTRKIETTTESYTAKESSSRLGVIPSAISTREVSVPKSATPTKYKTRTESFSSKKASPAKAVDKVVKKVETKKSSAPSSIQAGTLTAGEIDDFQKWELWTDISKNEFNLYQNKWKIYPNKRILVQVNNTYFPAIGAHVKLLANDSIVWESRTDNTGKAELWLDFFNDSNTNANNNLSLSVSYQNETQTSNEVKIFKEGINVFKFNSICATPENLDVVMLVDATGSMKDEINYLKVELNDVIQRIKKGNPALNMRLGSIFYRDFKQEYLTKISPISEDIDLGIDFIKEQYARDGGDYPEAIDIALEHAIDSLEWSKNALAKIIFIVADAPPHHQANNLERISKYLKLSAKKGIRIVPVTASGIRKDSEFLYRSFALASNGNYVYITDDSGVGKKHLKPSTDKIDVKLLNNLLVKIVKRYTETIHCSNEALSDSNNQNQTIIKSKKIKTDFVKLFPNPNNGNLNLKTNTALDNVFVTDLNGKIIAKLSDNLAVGKHFFRLDYLPNGIYFIKFLVEGKPEMIQFVIQN